MIGTNAIYEYAARAIGACKPNELARLDALSILDETRIAVGPSAPPIIPIEDASKPLKPHAIAMKKAANIAKKALIRFHS